MPRYLAAVRLRSKGRGFVIASPDFPDVDERCKELNDVARLAAGAIRGRLSKLVAEKQELPRPTPKAALETRASYRECFLIGVEMEDGPDPSTRADE